MVARDQGCRSGLESNELIEGMFLEVKSIEFVSGLHVGGITGKRHQWQHL